jgi:ABC-2 type transport system ATP-binding protein
VTTDKSAPTTAAPAIDLRDVTISYNEGAFTAVDGLTLQVPAGQVLGLLGGNGAGKTSTMKALAGVIPISGGQLHVSGYDMSNVGEAELARTLLGYCPDTGGLIRQATVREHVGMALAIRGMTDAWPYAIDLIEKFGLSHVLDVPTSGFSHGMSRRLSVVLAALTSQAVLILDEPFDGVDPRGVKATEDIIRQAQRNGLAVIVSTHLLSLLAAVTDRITVLVDGKLVDDAPSSAFTGKRGAQRYAALLASK